jgi:ATP-dependent exoDNAse (exonuclease V) beta subunit
MDRARAEGREYRVGVLVRAKRHVAQIAAALRDASIGYRAIELETLEDRQEVRDLLSLVRALFSPVDRVAWLSVLRAPWCGLSLMDLHMLSGNDDPALLKKPIPEMLETRMALLSEDGARRAERVYRILRLAVDQRFSGQFSASPNGLAAWVERTWHSLGGHHCVDANAYENVQAFFRLLATMTPDGMVASLSLLKQRLEKFFAQPATEATEKNGVQLMTIHKAKGLGFDVVLTPSLGRPSGRTDNPLLQWMARTKHGSDERELLIAPIGSLGDEGSATYKWVGKQREHEEREELNRLLYVACTRARSELYLFGSVGVKDGKIKKPETGTLLATGWAYLERIFQEQFAERQAAGPVPVVARHASTGTDPGVRSETWATPFPGELKIAARASGQILRRLPVDWDEGAEAASSTSPSVTRDDRDSSERSLTVAGLTARAVGVVVHALFQQMAGLADDDPRRDVIASTDYWQNVGRVLLRNEGLSAKDVAAQMGQVITMLRTAAGDATGRWILARRREARSESAWTSYGEEGVRTVRADRVFIAGSEPLSSADSHLWVVDYKTGEMENLNLLAGAPGEGSRYKEQLQQYGRVLREALGGALPLRFALYYPAAPHLDWWRE